MVQALVHAQIFASTLFTLALSEINVFRLWPTSMLSTFEFFFRSWVSGLLIMAGNVNRNQNNSTLMLIHKGDKSGPEPQGSQLNFLIHGNDSGFVFPHHVEQYTFRVISGM